MKLVLIWIQVARNKSQIPWELVELSPTQRSEMDGSHYMSLLQFIRQTVNMLRYGMSNNLNMRFLQNKEYHIYSAIKSKGGKKSRNDYKKLLHFKYFALQT